MKQGYGGRSGERMGGRGGERCGGEEKTFSFSHNI